VRPALRLRQTAHFRPRVLEAAAPDRRVRSATVQVGLVPAAACPRPRTSPRRTTCSQVSAATAVRTRLAAFLCRSQHTVETLAGHSACTTDINVPSKVVAAGQVGAFPGPGSAGCASRTMDAGGCTTDPVSETPAPLRRLTLVGPIASRARPGRPVASSGERATAVVQPDAGQGIPRQPPPRAAQIKTSADRVTTWPARQSRTTTSPRAPGTRHRSTFPARRR
jgi:hypothetical protein